MNKINDAFFSNFIVESGGAFIIDNNEILIVKNIRIFNISTTNFYKVLDHEVAGPGFISSGSGFYGSNIRGENLKVIAKYRDIFGIFVTQTSKSQLNDTCLDNTYCLDTSIVLNKGICTSKGINCTRQKVDNNGASFHFGYYVASYYQTDVIGVNNTGNSIYGHSCSSNDQQTSKNIIFIENKATRATFTFWGINHKITNGYILGNSENILDLIDTQATVAFDQCYHDGITGPFTETNKKEKYELTVNLCFHCMMVNTKKRLTIQCMKQKSTSFVFFVVMLIYS